MLTMRAASLASAATHSGGDAPRAGGLARTAMARSNCHAQAGAGPGGCLATDITSLNDWTWGRSWWAGGEPGGGCFSPPPPRGGGGGGGGGGPPPGGGGGERGGAPPPPPAAPESLFFPDKTSTICRSCWRPWNPVPARQAGACRHGTNL